MVRLSVNVWLFLHYSTIARGGAINNLIAAGRSQYLLSLGLSLHRVAGSGERLRISAFAVLSDYDTSLTTGACPIHAATAIKFVQLKPVESFSAITTIQLRCV